MTFLAVGLVLLQNLTLVDANVFRRFEKRGRVLQLLRRHHVGHSGWGQACLEGLPGSVDRRSHPSQPTLLLVFPNFGPVGFIYITAQVGTLALPFGLIPLHLFLLLIFGFDFLFGNLFTVIEAVLVFNNIFVGSHVFQSRLFVFFGVEGLLIDFGVCGICPQLIVRIFFWQFWLFDDLGLVWALGGGGVVGRGTDDGGLVVTWGKVLGWRSPWTQGRRKNFRFRRRYPVNEFSVLVYWELFVVVDRSRD